MTSQRNFIPHFIHTQYQAGRYAGRFRAGGLFIDISGFTALTENLMRHGKDGAEALTTALNGVFNPLVENVYAHGGFISTFAGDAFTALFPLRRKDALWHAAQTALFIRSFFANFGEIETPYGVFTLGVKVGLSAGEVQWGILGEEERYTYYFKGEAVDSSAEAEHHAEKGDIIISPSALPLLRPYLPDDFTAPAEPYRLHSLKAPAPRKTPRLPKLDREALRPFVLDAAVELTSTAEFRQSVSVFIGVQGEAPEKLKHLVIKTITLAHNYGGYFNKLDFGDKGGVMVVAFGAPVSHENDPTRAIDFILDLQTRTDASLWRAGVTIGTVYAGIIGGAERSEYTVIGDAVNLAARLMMGADWHEVWLSPALAYILDQQGYVLETVGPKSFKGKEGTTVVSRLLGKSHLAADLGIHQSGPLVDREAEMAQLLDFTQPIFNKSFAGLMYVYGEPGMGKTRLVTELRARLTEQRDAEQMPSPQWFFCPSDEILRQSLNPFRYWLRDYFSQLPNATEHDNKERFTQTFEHLAEALTTRGPLAHSLLNELDRTRSFLGALAGDLRWEGSLYEQLDPKLRFENTLLAVKTLILAESLRRPLILHLENAHLFDADSARLLQTLTRNVDRYPLAIILTCRYQDDGSKYTHPVDPDTKQLAIDLSHLSAAGVRALSALVLKGPVGETLGNWLAEKANSNPFFVEQLALDLRERGLAKMEAGQWELVGTDLAEVPASINAVLVSRLDRLSAHLKSVVQTASVLGQEFEVRVLSNILQEDDQLMDDVHKAEQEAIWLLLSEMRYIFRHALLRDAAYAMQLRAHRRELHALASIAIEKVHHAELPLYYADLAYHYSEAQNTEQERRYAKLAGEQAVKRFANAQALQYFNRALQLTPPEDFVGRYELLLARERLYDLQGARTAQAEDLAALHEIAESLNDDARRAEVALRQSDYASATDDYATALVLAKDAMQWAKRAGVADNEIEGSWAWSAVLWRQGDYTAARAQMEITLALAREAGRKDLETRCLNGLGLVSHSLSEHAVAWGYYQHALRLAHEVDDRLSQAKINNNLGNTLSEQGDPIGANHHLEEALRLYREMGDRLRENMTLSNLGGASLLVGDHKRANDYFERARLLFRETGNRSSEGAALENLSLVAHQLDDNELARQYGEEALTIAREIGNKNRQGFALTNLGHAFSGLGLLRYAREAYREALELRRELGQTTTAMEDLAGLSRVALWEYIDTGEERHLTDALDFITEVLQYVETKNLDGTDEPFKVWLTCYRVLQAVKDPRARPLLERAYNDLEAQAKKISDPVVRQMFLESVPHHWELRAAWAEEHGHKAAFLSGTRPLPPLPPNFP